MLKPVALVIVTGRSTEKRIMVVLVLYDGAAGVLFSCVVQPCPTPAEVIFGSILNPATS